LSHAEKLPAKVTIVMNSAVTDIPFHERRMAIALEEAHKAYSEGEVPVGAVILGADGEVLARAHNRTVTDRDPTAHAEMLVLREAASRLGNERLTGAALYVTVEPCCMCAGAAVWARIGRLVFGAVDRKAGGVRSLYRITEDERLNHRVEVTAGILEAECRELMQRFFRERRSGGEKH